MLESLPIQIIIGTILGFLSGLGIGGGSLLIIWLVSVLHVDPIIARCINLMFFVPSALIACIIRRKNQQLDLKTPIWAILAGAITAFITSRLSMGMDISLLKKLFGGILILAGLKELLYRPRNAR